ncbi:BspA family leucine-rich repeat surface protein, partial [Pseudoalteromonas sp.]|uniref:BspA family leucine-rich repeat surface protein n=1 Tax=Pseudoalteromonas sp. TaxID=53249 RepID=UPI0026130F55
MSLLFANRALIKAAASNAFVFTINTTLGTGSNIQLPLPSGQTYNFTVDWGDGNSDVITAYNQTETLHTYSAGGIYTISISGKCGGWSFANTGDKLKITSVVQGGSIGVDYLGGAFYGCSNLSSFNASGWDVSNVANFSSFLSGCTSLTILNVSSWNVSSATDFTSFAYGCTSLTTLDVSSWVTSSVLNFSWFVSACTSLTTLDVSSWNVSSATDFSYF